MDEIQSFQYFLMLFISLITIVAIGTISELYMESNRYHQKMGSKYNMHLLYYGLIISGFWIICFVFVVTIVLCLYSFRNRVIKPLLELDQVESRENSIHDHDNSQDHSDEKNERLIIQLQLCE